MVSPMYRCHLAPKTGNLLQGMRLGPAVARSNQEALSSDHSTSNDLHGGFSQHFQKLVVL